MKKFQIIFRTNSLRDTASKRIYVSALDEATALQTAKIELSSRGYTNGFIICAVNPL